METQIQKLEKLMIHLEKEEASPEICSELNKILKNFQAQAEYLREAEKPLGTIATSTSALTIVSILLLLNGKNNQVQLFSLLSLLFMLATVIGSLFFVTMVFRASFRLSRVRYHIRIKGYLIKVDYSAEEFADMLTLLKLAKESMKTLDKMEKRYQRVLWKSIFLFLSTILVLLFVATLLQYQ